MEILQTIWTALTTENEMLSSILGYSLTFVEITFTMLIFTNFLNISATNKQKLTYVISFSLISIFSGFFVPAPYNTFINVLFCPLLVICIFKTKIFTAILAEIIPYAIFVLIASVTLGLLIFMFNVTTDMVVNVPIYRIINYILTYLIVYLIYMILKKFNINITLFDNINKKSNSILLINFLIGVLAVCVQSYIASLYSDVLPFGVIILNISTLLFYFIFSLYSLFRTNKLEIAERDLEQSKQYINTLTILHDNIRCFKHDFGNMVTTIGRLCTDKQYGRPKNLLFSIIF